MTYTVIDRRTGKPADAHEVITDLFLPELIESHGSFAVDPDGVLLVLDCCGNYAYLDCRLFTAEWTEDCDEV